MGSLSIEAELNNGSGFSGRHGLNWVLEEVLGSQGGYHATGHFTGPILRLEVLGSMVHV